MTDINLITDPKERFVSGPVNIVRLEGQINRVNKVIYLFLDYHIDVTKQTQCANIFSKDVQKYFVDNFYKLNEGDKMYDFFIEIYPTELANNEYKNPESVDDYKDKYIEEVVKLFRKIFKYDAKKNKVTTNKLFNNIRLHYLDIRDYYKLTFISKIGKMRDIVSNMMKSDYINYQSLLVLIDLMMETREYIQFIVSILQKNQKSNIPTPKIIRNQGALDPKVLEYLTKKIKVAYKYPAVKKIMNELIDLSIKNFKLTITEIDQAIIAFNKYADVLSQGDKLIRDKNTTYIYTYGPSQYTIREMIVDIVNKVEKIAEEKFTEFFARFTDIYFLRRFLDKDYITNAIVYSGALHSNTYISVLIKNFNFKITHISYSKNKDIAKLNAEIKKRPLMEIQELILPAHLVQCSNMDDFPDEFQ